ncbi:MAG: RNA polymerase sigma factor [Flavobacteriales bacterium]|nr:RNA polymerase sigma factor [Flavobacteriales bacterium]
MKVDHKIIELCIKSNRKAQFQLYDLCYSRLMSIGFRYEKNEQDVASLVNASFFKILKSLKSYSAGQIPFDLWIRRIMINTVIDHYRSNKRIREQYDFVEIDLKEVKESLSINESHIYDRFEKPELYDLLHCLPNVALQVFNLYAIDGYSHKEIATMLEISENTSKAHLFKARKKLQKELAKRNSSSQYQIAVGL